MQRSVPHILKLPYASHREAGDREDPSSCRNSSELGSFSLPRLCQHRCCRSSDEQEEDSVGLRQHSKTVCVPMGCSSIPSGQIVKHCKYSAVRSPCSPVRGCLRLWHSPCVRCSFHSHQLYQHSSFPSTVHALGTTGAASSQQLIGDVWIYPLRNPREC